MTKLSNLLYLFLITLLLNLNSSCSTKNSSYDESHKSVSSSLTRLAADGPKVVNASGEEVILRAVGLGGWLLQEGYMLNPNGSDIGTQWQMKKAYYDEGLTFEEVASFYQNWRDNFITQADINDIASMDFNAVRLPMHYELFLTSEQRRLRNQVIQSPEKIDEYISGLSKWMDQGDLFRTPDELEGIQVIDRLLDWCGEKNMYVILDLHAAPGGQGTDSNIADILVKNDLWNRKDDKGRLIYQDVTLKLWEMLARRYINDDRIAFYDLINEPNNVPSNQPIHNLFERLINKIRSLGDTHLIMIEGNGWGNNYDHMIPTVFSQNQNLIYNAHRYWIPVDEDTILDPNPNQINRIVNLIAFREKWNVPVWVGETGENNQQWLKQNIEKLEQANIGWCHWTYKRFDVSENAALRRINGQYPTEGKSVTQEVLKNIHFEHTIPNTTTIQSVAPSEINL
ncbi:cellulase family glycosylhydrolase [Echinicola sp. CAU 1574]|uniref:Cellulase family glycosylhydrolase n=1 Tax=Echinicola arenosa TaxID=2774144 RepID=A0ABR9AGP6_9BACT|nr:cellulase family glycosylhydrolase [Echinicola arenosa]MBD8488025.1 cellulase family glycosylhydrolase [Echinicola arenosa]